uniref:L1 transposable element RRM domain-containing protein n=1 Tax=Sus scrofa TaxID=9823 RepID=A0A8D1CF52_PIG
MTVKMMQDIQNSLEAKTDNLQQTLGKEIQDLKLKQAEMQNTITEKFIRSNQEQIQLVEEQISKVEDRLVEITEQKRKEKKRLKRNEESLGDHWENITCTNIRIIGVPEGEEREKGTEKNIPRDNTRENFPNMRKEPLTQIQEARVPYKINSRKNTLRHISIKLPKIKNKEKILKAAREKKQVTYKGTPIRLSAHFSAETLQARREWHNILHVMKGKNLQDYSTQQGSH